MPDSKTKPVHKGVYILPNLLTTASLFAGFLGITWAIKGDFEATAIAILISALLDGLDGKVARLTGTASEFGVQLDSLADLVAFGVTPALLVYQWHLDDFGRLGLAASFLIVACGALRLARFNISTAVTPKKYFIGLPIPAQGCIMATFVLFEPFIPESLRQYVPSALLVLAYATSFLMVSRVRFASFKEYGFVKAHPFSSMVTVILLFVTVASQPRVLGFLVLLGYMISGPIYTYYLLLRRPHILRGASKKLS